MLFRCVSISMQYFTLGRKYLLWLNRLTEHSCCVKIQVYLMEVLHYTVVASLHLIYVAEINGECYLIIDFL